MNNLRCTLRLHDWELVYATDQYAGVVLEGRWECDRCGKTETGMIPFF